MAATNGKDVATAEKRTRTKKGEGPYTLAYTDGDNKDFPRVPANVHAVKITDKAGKVQSFAVSSLPPTIILGLAAEGLYKRLGAGVRNGIDDSGSNSLEIAAKLYASVKEGKLTVAREGGKGGPGRQFDPQIWVDIMERTAKLKKKATTEKAIADFRTMISALKTDERNSKIKTWMSDPIFATARKQITAERAVKAIKNVAADAPNALDGIF